MTHYYLYKITNLVNDKIYVGVHKTSNLEDGYMGSGKVIRRALEKYGLSNFKKDILEFFATSEAMYAREKEVVTPEFLLREDTYNLRRGGHGGFDYINANQLQGFLNPVNSRKGRETTNKILELRYGEDWRKVISAIAHSKLKFLKETVPGFKEQLRNGSKVASDAALSSSARKKRKETLASIQHQQGTKNSQFGTMWITNGIENKKIKKDAVIPEGWNKGRKCNMASNANGEQEVS
jgi:hypothetical protein